MTHLPHRQLDDRAPCSPTCPAPTRRPPRPAAPATRELTKPAGALGRLEELAGLARRPGRAAIRRGWSAC